MMRAGWDQRALSAFSEKEFVQSDLMLNGARDVTSHRNSTDLPSASEAYRSPQSPCNRHSLHFAAAFIGTSSNEEANPHF